MKIRTQLIVTLLLLSILPMSLLVAFNYSSSIRALRRAVQTETAELAGDMELRMAAIGGEIERRVARLGDPLGRLASRAEAEESRRVLMGEMAAELGETAPLVDFFEYVPERPPPPPPERAAPLGPAAPAPPLPPESLRVQMNEVLEVVGVDVTDVPAMMTHVEERLQEVPAGIDRELLLESARSGLEAVATLAQSIRLEVDVDEEIAAEIEEARREAALARHEEREALAARWRARRDSMIRELTVPVRENGRRVGSITAAVRGDEVLRQILEHTRREQGEIPFALDRDGELFALTAEDRQILESIPVSAATRGVAETVNEHWVVVVNEDPQTGMHIGIARPIRESLEEMRRAALVNFGFGGGLIGLALLGILPLSRRMTRDLRLVTEGAGAIASGDLETRVQVSSRNEIGRLAGAFNQMAADLADNQSRLLAESRRRRDQEVEQQLLRSEFDRKSRELEEARRFQLSLLPRELPRHPGFEVAVDMRTATEVGGDYYDFHLAPDGGLTIAIGDATGHGARAGTMVTAVKSLFSAYAAGQGLAEFLAQAAAAVKRMDLGRMAMALTVARLEGRRLRLASAGMPPPLLHRAKGGGVEEIVVEGMPLGGLQFAYREIELEVAAGDTLLLMSDGFPELVGTSGDPLGYSRAAELYAETAAAPPDQIIARLERAVEEWSGKAGLSDDVTFVVLRVC